MKQGLPRTWRIALPFASVRKLPVVGERFTLRSVSGLTTSDVVAGAELHTTSTRPIKRMELIQRAWRSYQGPYWLLTLRAA